MKKISADYIFPGNTAPIKNGVIVFDKSGIIEAILDPLKTQINWVEVKKYEGIICPGFVNTHCHLELSYLKGKITEQTQLHGFIKEVATLRNNYSEEEKQVAIKLAGDEMLRNGIVAVGDISNGKSTFTHKESSKIKYHTFIEVFGLSSNEAAEIMKRAKHLKRMYFNQTQVSITAHAPYSLSQPLIKLINKECSTLLSIHNQETASENELFLTKSGKLYERLSDFNEEIKTWVPTKKNSLPSYLHNFPPQKKTLLVHNTFTNAKDIFFAKNYTENIYWCFCPNANEYIENKQPDYTLFTDEKCMIGTDSLASNWSLSVLDELKTISKKDPLISLKTLIKWGTFNGAQFLGFDMFGSIEKGKQPGLNLITDIIDLKLSETSSVTKII